MENLGIKEISMERVDFLGGLSSREFTESKDKELRYKILRFVFDAIAITQASNSKEKLEISNDKLLGDKDDLRGKSKNVNNQKNLERQLDWIFQTVIQSWMQMEGSGPLTDIKKGCDYYFKDDQSNYLIECKNLHKGTSNRPNVLSEKVEEKISKNQLRKTEQLMKIDAKKLMFIDISEYDQKSYRFRDDHLDIEITGTSRKLIKRLIKKFEVHFAMGNLIDQLIFCWNEVIYINGDAIALRKNCAKTGNIDKYNFDGLAIEFLPINRQKLVFSELHFRKNVVGKTYLKEMITMMNNYTNPKASFKTGAEESNK